MSLKKVHINFAFLVSKVRAIWNIKNISTRHFISPSSNVVRTYKFNLVVLVS